MGGAVACGDENGNGPAMSPVMNDLDPVPRPLDRLPLRGEPDAMALVDRGGGLTYAALD